MGRWAWGLALVVLAGCASAGGSGPSGTLELLRRAGSREPDPPRDGSEAFVVDTVAAPAEQAFAVLRGAYTTMKIPFTYYAPERLELGGFARELADLGDDPPSTYIDCGAGVGGRSYADSYEVSVAVGTRVTPLDSATSAVETVIRARGKPRDVGSDLIRCTSLGTFEGRIADLVRRALAR